MNVQLAVLVLKKLRSITREEKIIPNRQNILVHRRSDALDRSVDFMAIDEVQLRDPETWPCLY